MTFIINIKDKFGKRKIKKILKLNNRRVKVTNFANAHSIGVVYPISTIDYQDLANKYIDFLRGEIGFKTIVAIGFYEGKDLPNFISDDSIKHKYFTRKNLNFSRLGQGKDIEEFIQQEFDILIDFSRDFVVPIKHLVASSQAKLKIGRYSLENENFYDFMINMDEKAPVSEFLKEVNTFLTRVNPK